MVLPSEAGAGEAMLAAGLLQDPDLHTRLATILALADQPASAAIGKALYAASREPDNFGDLWLSRALHIAAVRHQEGFLTAYRADPEALPTSALPVALRLGDRVPDWRQPDAASLATDWKAMDVPGPWESQGLPDFDGVVWFTRTVEWAAGATASTLALGRIGNVSEAWINGEPLGAPRASPGGRGPVVHALPAGLLRSGTNRIAVRIRNFRRDGGFLGEPEDRYLQGGEHRVPLAGTWRYRAERQTNAAALYTTQGELAAHVAAAASPDPAETLLRDAEPTAPPAADVVLQLGVVPNQLQFDRRDLQAAAGQLVELVFTNPDVMPHNFLLGAPGSLERIGGAADAMATSPDGLAQQYVPAIPQVLFATALVDPGESVTVQFRAPDRPGEYPYVCTFPAHWRVMNGVLRVVPAGPETGPAADGSRRR